MSSILQNEAIDKLPVAELALVLAAGLEGLAQQRLRVVGQLAVEGVLGGQSPW
jgi:hypothetical protein